jgi:hypothetical protein
MADLKTELATDPLGRGYDAMSDQEAADDLNSIYPSPDTRTRDRASLTASEVYNAVDQAGWAALSTADQQEVWNILHMGEVNPFGREAVRFTSIFGGGSATITALKVARVESITRAQELQDADPDFPSPVWPRLVTAARAN